MNDEYDDGYEDEPRLSIVDELTPHDVLDDEPIRAVDTPTLRIVDELPLVEVDDEPALSDGDSTPTDGDSTPDDGVLVIVSDEQLQSALRDPEISAEDESELEPAADDEPAIEVVSGEDELATDDEPADEDEPPSPPGVPDAERPARPRRPQWERPTRIAVAALALIAILFLFVFPTRSYLGQQRQVRTDRHSVAILQAQNKDMAREVAELQTKSEIERMARVQLNMVLPGEQPYSVITPHK